MEEPARGPRSVRDRLSGPRPAEVPPDPPGGQAPDTPISRLIWHDFVEAEIAPLRAAVARLEGQTHDYDALRAAITRIEGGQTQDHEAFRAASSGWAEQIGYVRGQSEGLEERFKADRQ